MSDWNRQIIEEFRSNGGKVGGSFEGAPLLLLTTTGTRSGIVSARGCIGFWSISVEASRPVVRIEIECL